MPRDEVLAILAVHRADLERLGVGSLAVFGSVARDEARLESDVDVLVEFEAGHMPGFLALARMEGELSDLLGGHSVDLRTPRDLSRYFRDEVLAAAEVQYAAP